MAATQKEHSFKGKVVIAAENDSVQSAAKLLEEHHIGAVVITRKDAIVGILSERDIVTRVVSKGLSPEKVRIKEVMTQNVTAVDMKEGLGRIVGLLRNSSFRHVPIVDGGKLVGMVSSRDLLYLLDLK